MSNVWANVSIIVRPHRLFTPTNFVFEKRIGLVSIDFLYIIFTYFTHDNQHECFSVSNWFAVWYLVQWMNRLPPVWWYNGRFMFLKESWCVSLTWWRGIFYRYLVFIVVCKHCRHVTLIIPLISFHTEIAFLIPVLGTTISINGAFTISYVTKGNIRMLLLTTKKSMGQYNIKCRLSSIAIPIINMTLIARFMGPT